MNRPLLRQAEQNVINQAKAWSDAIEFLDALSNFGNIACHEHIGRAEFFEGLKKMRRAMWQEQSEAIRNCFTLSGVGGEAAAAFSRERFKDVFSGKYQVVQFLNKWGHCPSYYTVDEMDRLKSEAKDAIEDQDALPGIK